jgi:hypothetical protein
LFKVDLIILLRNNGIKGAVHVLSDFYTSNELYTISIHAGSSFKVVPYSEGEICSIAYVHIATTITQLS